MKSGKTFLAHVILTLLLAVLVPVHALADALYLPGESFYSQHIDEIKPENTEYTANGPSGQLKGYISPEKAEIVETVKNGEALYIKGTYQDVAKIVWGYYEDADRTSYWVPMDYLLTPFTGEMFLEQYKEELKEITGEAETKADSDWHAFSYPGADQYETVPAGESIGTLAYEYTDAAGILWNGYVKDGQTVWVPKENPQAEPDDLYPEDARNVDKRTYEDTGINGPEIVPSERSLYKNIFFIMMGLSMGAMVVMAVIVNIGIAKKYRKNK